MHADRLLRVDQVATRLNISKRQAYRLISGGCFLTLKVGCSLRVIESSIDKYVHRQIEAFEIETGIIFENVPDETRRASGLCNLSNNLKKLRQD